VGGCDDRVGGMARGSVKKNNQPITRRNPYQISAWDPESGHLNVVVDTPRGSAIKFKYDSSKQIYKISHLLPPGTVFPFDFGSIPSTLAEDGDPLDVLILMEEGSFAGCLVPVRVVGVLQADQTQEGKTQRNDRLIGVGAASRVFETTRTLKDLPVRRLTEIEHYFVSYNKERGRKFRPLGHFGPSRAKALIRKAEKRYRDDQDKHS
jgi:inorganic pyrophosphatase